MASESQGAGAPSRRSDSGRLVGGIVLILIGFFALAGQVVQNQFLGQLFPVALGVIFLAWGGLTRRFGLLIPGGIFVGVGAAALLLEGPFTDAAEETKGGIFFLVFAAGWVVIALASALFTSRTRLWPLIVAAVFAAIGLLMVAAGPAFDTIVSSQWLGPVLLIGIGVFLLLFRRERHA